MRQQVLKSNTLQEPQPQAQLHAYLSANNAVAPIEVPRVHVHRASFPFSTAASASWHVGKSTHTPGHT